MDSFLVLTHLVFVMETFSHLPPNDFCLVFVFDCWIEIWTLLNVMFFRPSCLLSVVESLLNDASKVPVHLPVVHDLRLSAERASGWMANVENLLVSITWINVLHFLRTWRCFVELTVAVSSFWWWWIYLLFLPEWTDVAISDGSGRVFGNRTFYSDSTGESVGTGVFDSKSRRMDRQNVKSIS